MSVKPILVTGGAGYIGSQTCKALAQSGYEPIVYDNFETGLRAAVKWGPCEEGDIRDTDAIRGVIKKYRPHAIVHFAAYLKVEESVRYPGKYYLNNVGGTVSLLEAMRTTGIDKFVFSSTAAVYGEPQSIPTAEDHPLAPINPYGESKRIVESILPDFEAAHGIGWAALRYFNAAGADPDGELGPNHDPITHLIPVVLRAGLGTGPTLTIFGTDYPTPDGTAIRDYIHVTDLAAAHVAALRYLFENKPSGAFNLGMGKGYSVREVVEAATGILGKAIPFIEGERRAGDPPALFADPTKANRDLNWTPRYSDLETIVRTAAEWERNRPH